VESETRIDSDDDGSDGLLFYGLKLRAADPRYISDRGDILLTPAQVRELILEKQQSEEEVATVWLTTADMGFPLTEEPNEVVCPKDVREGKATDRFLAPAISRFATTTIAGAGGGADRDQQAPETWRELVHLHHDGANLAGQQKGIASESWLAMTPMRRANSPELSNARISHGSETPSQEWLMIRCTSRIAMFRPQSESTFFSTNRSQKG
jgi:hypothetical protein